MTRGQITSAALRRAFPAGIGLPEGSHRDPFFVNEELDAVCDEIMRGVEEAYLFFSIDVNSGQARRCWPPLLEITGADVLMPVARGGSSYPLQVTTDDNMQRLSPTYVDVPASGSPQWLVTEARSAILLVPTPDYTQALGLTVHGIGLWNKANWASASAECPLPIDQHLCVVYGLTYRIATDAAIRDTQMREFLYLKGHIASEMGALCEAARSRSYPDGPRAPVGPLDL